ncbi:yeats family-domain-containing protein [Obelidium mucronatum]|nr:yeats family-domain-containing protein [Obelidium mucronatum]
MIAQRRRIRVLDEATEDDILNDNENANDTASMDVDMPSKGTGENNAQAEWATTNPQNSSTATGDQSSTTRFLIKQRIVVGNVSRYIPEEKRKLPKFEYKWMIYVQGPPTNPDVTPFISRVRFHLHPDYRPNDVIDVSSPPFQVTRYGWGEFPVRVRLFFVDPRNKTMDLMYSIKLDRTMSGRQTLGGEVWTDLLLDKNTEFRDSSKDSVTNEKRQAVPEVSLRKSGFGHSKRRGGFRGRPRVKKESEDSSAAADGENVQKFPNVGVKEEGVEVKEEENGQMVVETFGGMNEKNEEDGDLEDVVVEMLENLVEKFPLIKNEREVSYEVAESIEAYESMEESERNRLEIGRASALLLQAQRESVSSSHAIFQVTAADVSNWCRN